MRRALFPLAFLAAPAFAQTEEPTACLDALRGVMLAAGGQSDGEVLSSSFSEAGTLVYLQDAGETVWRCIAYQDGTVGELAVVMDEAERVDALNPPAMPEPEAVEFAAGESSTELERELEAGGAMQFSLTADGAQTMTVEVQSDASGYFYVRGPGDAVVHDPVDVGEGIEVTLPAGGDYIVELVSQSDGPANFALTFAIE